MIFGGIPARFRGFSTGFRGITGAFGVVGCWLGSVGVRCLIGKTRGFRRHLRNIQRVAEPLKVRLRGFHRHYRNVTWGPRCGFRGVSETFQEDSKVFQQVLKAIQGRFWGIWKASVAYKLLEGAVFDYTLWITVLRFRRISDEI